MTPARALATRAQEELARAGHVLRWADDLPTTFQPAQPGDTTTMSDEATPPAPPGIFKPASPTRTVSLTEPAQADWQAILDYWRARAPVGATVKPSALLERLFREERGRLGA